MPSDPALTRSLCRGPATPCPVHLRKYVLAVAVMGSALGFIDGTIITVAVKPMREALGTSFAAMQWVVNGYTLALSAFLLVGGAAGDRFGKRRVFAAGIALFALASAACALAPTAGTLIAARVIQGFGAALLVPGSLALIAINFPEAERGRAIGIWAAASGVTTALGPLLGGFLIDVGSWRAIFFVNLPLAALTLFILLLKVPRDPPSGAGRFDILGGVFAFLAVGLVALAFTRAEQTGLFDGGVIAVVLCGLAAGAAFLGWQGRTATPMMPLSLFSSRTFAVANASTLLIYFALGGTVFFLPITMMEAHGWSALQAGAIFVPFTLTMSVTAPFAGQLADKVGQRTLLVAGPLIVAAAFVWLGQAAMIAEFWRGVAPAMVAFGLGMGLAIPPLSTAVLNDVSPARTGIASGVNNAISRVAGLFAVAILGLVATLAWRALTGEDSGFAADAPDLAADARSAAILATFAMLAAVCAVLAALGGLLALALPRVGASAPAAPA